MKILFLILKIYLIAFVIVFPIAWSFCKASANGDKLNKLINKDVEE